MPSVEHRDRLIDHVVLVRLQVLPPTSFDQLDHPSGIQIDTETDPATVLGQMLDRKAQPSRAGRSEHQPVRAFREVLIGQGLAEQLVVDPEVLARHPRLGDARRAARLEHKNRLPGKAFGNPAPDGTAAQPFVLELTEAPQVDKAGDLPPGIPPRLPGELQPEGTAGLGVEVPLDDLSDPRVERIARRGSRANGQIRLSARNTRSKTRHLAVV